MEENVLEKICLILLLNFLFFFKTLGYKYVSDDIPAFQRPKHANKWWQRFFVLEGQARSNSINDHALTTLIHALVCVGIYIGFGSNNVSFLAALLFAFNPINNQVSVWIAGRGYAFSALGMVWAMAMPFIGPIFLFGATYYNAGFLAPLTLVGSEHSWLLVFMPLIWFYHIQRFKRNVGDRMSTEMFAEDKRIHPRKLILATKTFGFYLSHSLVPIKTTFYHSMLESIAGCKKHKAYTLCRFFWFGALSLTGIFAYWILVPWNMVSFGLLWWCICIAPYLNLMRMSQELAERYAYLPNCGLMLVLATVLYPYPAVAAFFLGMYATKLWFYMDCYQDDYYLIEHACMHSPDSWFAWHIRGHKRWDTGSYKEAMILWTMAKMISPKEFKVLFNLAAVLRVANEHKEAESFLKLAEQNMPEGQEAMLKPIVDNFRKGQLTVII